MATSKWHGGKGDRRRTKADDKAYRDGWDRIFGSGQINPCVVCGKDWSNDLIDTVYPCDRTRTRWNVVCQIHNTGCGRIVYGKTEQQAIERWNEGYTDEQ
jgi:hypothetical protein